MKYEYNFVGNAPEDILPFEPKNKDFSGREMAEQAASNYHFEHGGWESDWPYIFEIFCDGESLGKFDVDRDIEPVFFARPFFPPNNKKPNNSTV